MADRSGRCHAVPKFRFWTSLGKKRKRGSGERRPIRVVHRPENDIAGGIDGPRSTVKTARNKKMRNKASIIIVL